jgi:type II secretory pathway pseudopilin PulG
MRSGRRAQAGFTYLGVLVLVVLIGLMLASAGQVARTTAQRERETELLFIGHQYREAIGRFVRANHRYPTTLEELVQFDGAGPAPDHYLRRLYRDPMTRQADWTLIQAPGVGFMGVASSSKQVPLKHANFDENDIDFDQAETYADWQFVYNPRSRSLSLRPLG